VINSDMLHDAGIEQGQPARGQQIRRGPRDRPGAASTPTGRAWLCRPRRAPIRWSGIRTDLQETRVITAIVLIRTSVDRIPEIAETIAALDGVSEVYSVTGAHDLVAMVRVRHHDDLAEVIPGRLNKVPGVVSTETHIAFRTYSQHDLEAAFALGLDA
jgi:DNA-binding Lrp family transcriptional regulator